MKQTALGNGSDGADCRTAGVATHVGGEGVAVPSRQDLARLFEVVVGAARAAQAVPPLEPLAQLLEADPEVVGLGVAELVGLGILVPVADGHRVAPPRDWSFQALGHLRHLQHLPEAPPVGIIARDLVDLTEEMMLWIARVAPRRLSKGALDPARHAFDRVRRCRDDPEGFVRAHHEVMRRIAEAASLLPCLALLNEMEGVYSELFQLADLRPNEAYWESVPRLLDALEAGDGDDARAVITSFVEDARRHIVARMRGQPADRGTRSRAVT